MTAAFLIAEDNESNKALYAKLLNKSGWIAVSPSDFQEFSDCVTARFFHAYIFDINLDRWGVSLKDAMNVLPSQSLVFFASSNWNSDTLNLLSRATSVIKEKSLWVGALISLKEISSTLDAAALDRHIGSAQGSVEFMLNLRWPTKSQNKDTLRILHVSDPQFGDPNQDPWAQFVEEHISNYVQGTLNIELDIMAITGDLTFSGKPEDFKQARTELNALASKIWPDEASAISTRVLLVPGNHDYNFTLAGSSFINYSVTKASTSLDLGKDPKSYAKFGLTPFLNFSRDFVGFGKYSENYSGSAIIDKHEFRGLETHLLSSISGFSCASPKRPSVDTTSAKEMVREFRKKSGLPPFALALSHHGLYSEVEPILNQAEVASYFQANNIKVHMHGHGHKWSVNRVSYDGKRSSPKDGQLDSDEFVEIMAPTTHLNEKLRPPHELRGFNLITLSRENDEFRAITIQTFGWSSQFKELGRRKFRF